MLLAAAAEMQALDRAAMEEFGIPGVVLMENAGRGVAGLVLEAFPSEAAGGVLVLSGPGNNGGDGFVIARHLHQAGVPVRVAALAPAEKFRNEAGVNLEIVRRSGIPLEFCPTEADVPGLAGRCRSAGLLVDAVFGTGLAREVTGRFAEIIRTMNDAGRPVVSVDVPSGLSADTGRPLGIAVAARMTATMALPKLGLVVWPGRELAGELRVVDIGLPPAALRRHPPAQELLDEAAARELVRPRPPDGHKGTFGHLLVLAGAPGKTGAAALAAIGALRSGPGLVTVGTPAGCQPVLAAKLTEAMTAGLAETADGTLAAAAWNGIRALLEGKRALAVGPGLGLDEEVQELVRRLAAEAPCPAVLDADALTALGTEAPRI
ncbi:NAD(P)H-hydrate epimerase, partial [Dissulfurirhabdus thermomarina]